MKNTVIVNNVEYRQTETCPRIYIAKDGSYVIPEGREPKKVRYGTKMYNKNNYPLQEAICTTVKVDIDGKLVSKTVVKNVGRLVLDAWLNLVDESLEVDHIDRNPFNNDVNNLRLVTKSANMANRKEIEYPTEVPWLHTKEVNEKRMATKKAKKEGTWVKPVKETKEPKKTFEEIYREKQAEIKLNKELRKLESIKREIEITKIKIENAPNNDRSHKMRDKYVEKLEKLEQKVSLYTDVNKNC